MVDEPEIDLSPPPFVPTASASQANPANVTTSTTAPTPQAKTITTTTYTTPPPSGMPAIGLGRFPCQLTCPYCNHRMCTRTRDQVTGLTIAIMVIVVLLFWPLFWLPLCMPSCKATEHYCGNGSCNRKVGQVEPCN